MRSRPPTSDTTSTFEVDTPALYTTGMTDVNALGAAWLLEDPDAATRAQLETWLREKSPDLVDAFTGGLQFGTAGLRGILGPGPNRMNRVVVARATAGLCAFLLKTVPDAKTRGIAVEFDGRRMSREFANDVVEIVAGFGIKVLAFPELGPTPLLAFAVKDQNAAAGIMITASHNPPAYNGYKVYWGNGAQIIPPTDEGIAKEIAAVGPFAAIPRTARDAATKAGLVVALGEDVSRRYLDGIRGLQLHPETKRDITVAYTALHGVGNKLFTQAMKESGFSSVHSVAEQAQPDGAFPTVVFPNPEEKGAMDLVLALATKVNADVVLANDPDADRLAVAVRAGDGRYVQLSGNDVGALFGHYTLTEGKGTRKKLVACSIVSSPMLGAIANAHNAVWAQTLTGFKWIANRALEIEKEQPVDFVFGFEEALGYTIGTLVRDKDGIGAALVMADMAAYLKSKGRTLLDELDETSRKYGLFVSRTVPITMPGADGAARIREIMTQVREAPPPSVGDFKVVGVLDLERGTRSEHGKVVEKLTTPPSDVIALALEGGHRVMLRPSGTEPKIKFYFDLCIAIGDGESLPDARSRGDKLADNLVLAFRSIVRA